MTIQRSININRDRHGWIISLMTAMGFVLMTVSVAWAGEVNEEDDYLRSKAYVSLSGNVTLMDELDVQFVDENVPPDVDDGDLVITDFDFEPGFGVNAALGYQLFYPVRAEVEFSFRSHDLDDVSGSRLPVQSVDGGFNTVSIMFNLLADVHIEDNLGLYFGAGLGGTHVDSDMQIFFDLPGVDTVGLVDLEHDEIVFTYQLMSGVFVRVHEAVVLNIGYRAVFYQDLDIQGNNLEVPVVHAAELGVRFEF